MLMREGSAAGLGSLALGTASLARVTPDAASFRAAVDAALEQGIRYIDTAPMYECGHAERLLGRSLAERSQRPVLSTKVGRLVRPLAGDDPSSVPPEQFTRGGERTVFDFSADGIRTSLSESLERLDVDSVDIVYLHDPESEWDKALREAVPALLEMRETGNFAAIGIGTNHTDRLFEAVGGFPLDVVLVAGRYTLLDQSAEELFDLCWERGTRVVVGGVFNSGILAAPDTGTVDYRQADAEERARVRHLNEICTRHGVDLRAAAIQFPLAHPAVEAVLIGPEDRQQLVANAEASTTPLPEELWQELAQAGVRQPR